MLGFLGGVIFLVCLVNRLGFVVCLICLVCRILVRMRRIALLLLPLDLVEDI